MRGDRRYGPLRGRRIRGLLIAYACAYTAAIVAILAVDDPMVTAGAVGTIVAGAGLLYVGHWFLGVLALVLFVLSLPLHPLVTFVIWIGSAVGAVVHPHAEPSPWVAYLVPILPLIAFMLFKRRSDVIHAKTLERRIESCAAVDGRTSLTVRSQPGFVAGPLDERALTDLRFLLDRALQPLDTYHGFRSREEVTTAALRYQLSWAQLALAVYNHCRVPAFKGYLEEAQRNLILKMCERRVWSYWRYENALGNLDLDPEPIRRDNIMYSGYLGAMLGLYEATTGDQRFRESGSLTLHWSERTVFEYDAARVVEAVRRNFEAHSYCLYPCEPHLIYPVCNGFGIIGILLEDNLHPNGSPEASERLLDRYRESLEHEFMTADGRFEGMLMTSWGMRSPRGEVNDGIVGFLNHPAAPEIAERNWEMLRFFGVESSPTREFQLHGTVLDIGALLMKRTATLTGVALGAAEMGDREAYDRIMAELDRDCQIEPGGEEPRVKNLSNWARFNLAAARFVRPGGFHDVVLHGMPTEWRQGPVLDQAPYPEVLVSRAASDGDALELDLSPGSTDAGPQKLRLGQLRPGTAYGVTGAHEVQLRADPNGNATIHVNVEARPHISVIPVQ